MEGNILHIETSNTISWSICQRLATFKNQSKPRGACFGTWNCFFLIFLFGIQSSMAQDIHFSQFMSSPMNLNPAQTGNFDGAYRFTGNARRQWSSVTIPYQTFGLAVDARNFLRAKNVGAGISLYNDKTGDSHFSTLQLNGALSYMIKLNKDSTQFLSLGVQSGITQRKIDYSNLSYDNQFDGYIYNKDIPSIEQYQNGGRLYANLNAGINWIYNIKERTNLSAGVSLYNITRPRQSFFNNDQIRLDRRLNFNIGSQLKMSEKVDLLPAVLLMGQGTYREFIVGTSVKYILNPKRTNYRAVYAGGWARTRDAGFVSIGMDYDNWYVGLSYDINYSNLRPASNGRGGFELAVIYIIRDVLPKRLKYKVCPDFM
jgi:type IX secretion system PorP/SprF family membrane protein